MNLCFVKVRLVDAKGITVPVDDVELSATVQGGALAGFGSGNPCTDENYGTGKRRVWNGLTLVCLRSPEATGSVSLTVRAEGLPDAAIAIRCE